MRLLAIILFVAASNAWADWTLLGTVESRGGVEYYFDESTIAKSGDRVSLWMMEDHKVAQPYSGKTFLSQKVQHEFDCANNRRRTVQSAIYSQRKAEGDALKEFPNPNSWRPIAPGTIGAAILKIACGQ